MTSRLCQGHSWLSDIGAALLHRSYWAEGWPAVMVTETAFLRAGASFVTPDRRKIGRGAAAARSPSRLRGWAAGRSETEDR